MDVEGAEHLILPALLDAGATDLIDVLLWECHFGLASRCWKLKGRLSQAKIEAHHEPAECSDSDRVVRGGLGSNWDCYHFPERPPPSLE